MGTPKHSPGVPSGPPPFWVELLLRAFSGGFIAPRREALSCRLQNLVDRCGADYLESVGYFHYSNFPQDWEQDAHITDSDSS